MGIVITNKQGIILWGNEYYNTLVDFDIKEFIGKDIREIVQRNLVSVSGLPMIDRMGESCDEFSDFVKFPTNDFVATTIKTLKDDSGEVEYFIYFITNCSESIRLQEQMNQLNDRTIALESYLNQIIASSVMSKKLVVSDLKMQSIYKTAAKLAAVDVSVMILGESGVGKDVYAKFIHSISNRKEHNFIHVNLGAIPKSLFESELFGYEPGAFTGASRAGKVGLIELANKGTLFLDEIGEMDLDNQAKLLQVVQERCVRRIGSSKTIPLDIRIIAATNRNLEQMVKQGQFRLDLFYRLNVISVEIPPLRERKVEIPLLVNLFLEKFNEQYHACKSMSPAALNLLMNHDWPGNIRELNHVIESLVVIGNNTEIQPQDLPESVLNQKDTIKLFDCRQMNFNLKEATEKMEKQLILQALSVYKTTTAAAKAMDIDISTLSKKRKKYNI